MIPSGPGLRSIIEINGRFITAAFAILYGWLCWQGASPEWWGLGLLAILSFVGGISLFIGTLLRVVAWVARDRKIDAFTAQGAKARADRMARERDLKTRGMIR